LLIKPINIFEQFRLHFKKLLNNNSTNGNFDKYEKLIYQAAEPELAKPVPEEIELIIKDFKHLKPQGRMGLTRNY
jgi:hypothetical protein